MSSRVASGRGGEEYFQDGTPQSNSIHKAGKTSCKQIQQYELSVHCNPMPPKTHLPSSLHANTWPYRFSPSASRALSSSSASADPRPRRPWLAFGDGGCCSRGAITPASFSHGRSGMVATCRPYGRRRTRGHEAETGVGEARGGVTRTSARAVVAACGSCVLQSVRGGGQLRHLPSPSVRGGTKNESKEKKQNGRHSSTLLTTRRAS